MHPTAPGGRAPHLRTAPYRLIGCSQWLVETGHWCWRTSSGHRGSGSNEEYMPILAADIGCGHWLISRCHYWQWTLVDKWMSVLAGDIKLTATAIHTKMQFSRSHEDLERAFASIESLRARRPRSLRVKLIAACGTLSEMPDCGRSAPLAPPRRRSLEESDRPASPPLAAMAGFDDQPGSPSERFSDQ